MTSALIRMMAQEMQMPEQVHFRRCENRSAIERRRCMHESETLRAIGISSSRQIGLGQIENLDAR